MSGESEYVMRGFGIGALLIRDAVLRSVVVLVGITGFFGAVYGILLFQRSFLIAAGGWRLMAAHLPALAVAAYPLAVLAAGASLLLPLVRSGRLQWMVQLPRLARTYLVAGGVVLWLAAGGYYALARYSDESGIQAKAVLEAEAVQRGFDALPLATVVSFTKTISLSAQGRDTAGLVGVIAVARVGGRSTILVADRAFPGATGEIIFKNVITFDGSRSGDIHRAERVTLLVNGGAVSRSASRTPAERAAESILLLCAGIVLFLLFPRRLRSSAGNEVGIFFLVIALYVGVSVGARLGGLWVLAGCVPVSLALAALYRYWWFPRRTSTVLW